MHKLIHYSQNPKIKLKKNRDYFKESGFPFTKPSGKPSGLWVSVEDGNGWKDWCESEDFALYTLENSYEVTLKKNANVLILDTHEKIVDFALQFKDYSKERAGFDIVDGKLIETREEMITSLDWDIVKLRHQGVIIAPYRPVNAFSSEHYQIIWYWGWDCSSGCIWDLSCIKSFKKI